MTNKVIKFILKHYDWIEVVLLVGVVLIVLAGLAWIGYGNP